MQYYFKHVIDASPNEITHMPVKAGRPAIFSISNISSKIFPYHKVKED